MWFQKIILYKKASLIKEIEEPLAGLAAQCAISWDDAQKLDSIMSSQIKNIPHCHLLYALNLEWIQINSNIYVDKKETFWKGQNVSARPYIKGNLPYRGLILSSVYISKISLTHCITAMQAVVKDNILLGFIGADFNLNDLPEPEESKKPEEGHSQFKGDPSIRRLVFQQTRSKSMMDEHIDEVMYIVDTLFSEHGVFHVILHFSSSRAVFWLYDDPYNYHLNSIDEILDPEIWLAYPERKYPKEAIVSQETLRKVLQSFKALRNADENIYLRSSSVNIMNGMVGLTFSCDGSHYMQANEFIDKDISFWI